MIRGATISKTFNFEAAHQLLNHKGKCKNLHGHSYRVVFTISDGIIDNLESSDDGMVIDFSDVKDVIKPIIDEMDHSMLCDSEQYEWLSKNSNVTIIGETKLYNVGKRTTAENIAWHLFERVIEHIPSLLSVDVFETSTSRASVDVFEYERG